MENDKDTQRRAAIRKNLLDEIADLKHYLQCCQENENIMLGYLKNGVEYITAIENPLARLITVKITQELTKIEESIKRETENN